MEVRGAQLRARRNSALHHAQNQKDGGMKVLFDEKGEFPSLRREFRSIQCYMEKEEKAWGGKITFLGEDDRGRCFISFDDRDIVLLLKCIQKRLTE